MKTDRFIFTFVVLSLALLTAGEGACSPKTTSDVKTGVQAVKTGCALVEAVLENGTLKTLCAEADEIADLVSRVLGEARDAGLAAANKCTSVRDLAGREACATPAQIGTWIDASSAKRAARFMRDAGTNGTKP